ncbi:MAG: cobyrinate a,c-diamide synthase, partial [Tannerellaceae bacterium]|nr:cobyrinate a,c-diamide synthase [Tannerellaceae bacterium]
VEKGGKLWAECGGMMYLSESITDQQGTAYPVVGVFKQKATMQQMKLRLGYRQFNYNTISLKGHEFHYSTIESELTSQAVQYNAKGMEVDTKLLRYKNALAGYTHLYWGDKENILDIFK